MNNYPVTITETLQCTIEVEANSREEAAELTEAQWNNGDHILDADHFKGVNFSVSEVVMKQNRQPKRSFFSAR
jgi:hypothetical protein